MNFTTKMLIRALTSYIRHFTAAEPKRVCQIVFNTYTSFTRQ